jgi:hypothetical protein
MEPDRNLSVLVGVIDRSPHLSIMATTWYPVAVSEPVVRFRSRTLDRGRTLSDGHRVRAGAVLHETWLEDEITDQWMVAYRLVPQRGRPVVAEIRIYPGAPDTYANPGEWSAEWEGSKVGVPTGGLPAKVVTRQLKFHSYLSHFSEIIRAMEQKWGRDILYDDEGLFGRHDLTPVASESESRAGRPPEYDSLFLARMARDLNRAISDGHIKDPVLQLSKMPGYIDNVVKMHRLVQRSRNKGMLGSAPPGLSGGRLTNRAKSLLRAAGEEEE